MMKKYILLIFLFLVLLHYSKNGNSQEIPSDSTSVYDKGMIVFANASYFEPCTSLFIEFGGKGVCSLNIDFRKKEKHAFSIGIQGLDELMPGIMYYYFAGKKHRIEIGGGLGAVIGIRDGNIGVGGMTLHGVVGYRYQKKKGILFRAGITPFWGISFTTEGNSQFLPLAGLSIGYSF